jgi:site-specific DNA-methyltransferase (adenine-specific)
VLFTDWRQLPLTTDALQAGGFVWRGIAVWTKEQSSRPRMGGFRADAEFAVWGSKGPLYPRTEVGCLPGTIASPPVHTTQRLHLTEKPLSVMEAIVKVCPPGGLVLDPFSGSGSTGVACIRSGRRFVGVEKSESYFRIACERLRAEEEASTLEARRAGQLPIFGGAT